VRADEHQQSEVNSSADYVRGDSLEAMSACSPIPNPPLCKQLDGRPVLRSPQQLRLHRALDELGLTATVQEFDGAAPHSNRSLQEPILIAPCGTIVAGIRQWRLALFEDKREIHCIEYLLNEEECLEFIVRYHQRRRGWNAFIRIRLALTQEIALQRRALENMRAGGKYKAWANLPEAQRIDVRQEIATAAGVGCRNVSNVKTILQVAHPRLIEALSQGTLTINGAMKFCKLSRSEQLEQFIRHCAERATNKVIRRAIVQPTVEKSSTDLLSILDVLRQQEAQEPGSVAIRLSRHKQCVVLVGRDLLSRPLSSEELKAR
jgi:hypothetical protein